MQILLTNIALISAFFYVVSAIHLTYRLGSLVAPVVPALLFMAVWSIYGVGSAKADLVLISVWMGSFLFLLRANGVLAEEPKRSWFFWVLPTLPLVLLLSMNWIPSALVIYPILLLLVALLMVTELTIRTSRGSLRALAIGVGTLFLFQLYFYARAIATNSLSLELVGARLLLNGAISVLVVLTPFYIKNDQKLKRQLGLSRPMAFTTTSVLIAGGIITFIALLNFFLNTELGDHRPMIQAFLIFLCILIVGYSLGSSSQRARIKVLIDKHFFRTRFDHDREWKTLSDHLGTANAENFLEVALKATMSIYQSASGVLYIRNQRQFTAEAVVGDASSAKNLSEFEYEEFFELASLGWIFVKGSTSGAMAESFNLVPKEINQLGECLVLVPLIREKELIGLVVFEPDRRQLLEFDWEDLDLLKTVAKQISHFIAFHLLAKDDAVKRQFEAYHQFTTFVMHDLKNLVAQQELVVQNAERFKHNPEFVSDAITTIDNCVQRMTRLMSKISKHAVLEYEEEGSTALEVNGLWRGVFEKVGNGTPVPEISYHPTPLSVFADSESLTMALTHIVSNAQDACEDDGLVTVDIEAADKPMSVIFKIRDTGCGMSPDFIENRLFKPFDSTKKTVGMGIGAYQSREIISKIGGHISVESTPGVGSCFTVTLPSTPS